jgi:signal transduction histidine kinase
LARSAWVWWGAIFGLWTLLAVLSIAQRAVASQYWGNDFDWRTTIIASLSDWYTCAAFTPAYLWLARHYPIDRRRWPVGLTVHLVATSAFVVIKYAAYGAIRAAIAAPEHRDRWALDALLSTSFISESVAFWAVIGVVHAVEFYRRYQEREVQAFRLHAQLAEARLESLAAQLHPHFLFNTLHGVTTLMHHDVDAADTMLTRLSDLLRRALRNSDRPEVPLREELETLEHYLAIMRFRFHDRLSVTTTVDPACADALVPPFLLQPLVENALQHGIARRAGAGRISIAVRLVPAADAPGGAIEVAVTDDGAGIGRDAAAWEWGGGEAPAEGIGLSNTRRRLETLYGAAGRISLERAGEGDGVCVRVRLPLRVAEPAAAELARIEPRAEPRAAVPA